MGQFESKAIYKVVIAGVGYTTVSAHSKWEAIDLVMMTYCDKCDDRSKYTAYKLFWQQGLGPVVFNVLVDLLLSNWAS